MYRDEYPNPQFKRDSFECLNGEWEFEFGNGCEKAEKPLKMRIQVPFCVESELSGIGHTDFIGECIYARTINITESDLKSRLVLHFGAVDYLAQVYLNGKLVCLHRGGYTPFFAELNQFAKVGENRLTVIVNDWVKDDVPSGKQSSKLQSYGCFYTRCTGIWQTVWLERTPFEYIKAVRFYPDPDGCKVVADVDAQGAGELEIKVLYEGRQVGYAKCDAHSRAKLEIKLSEKHLWEIGNGRLYDVEMKFGDDKVQSYFGLRDVRYSDRKFLLNGKSVFQRLVLDQGYYPDGIYTARRAEDMQADIAAALQLGFNGARLHQKVFDPLYLYFCDRAGFIVWGEYASWGVKYSSLSSLGQFISEWTETVARDFNHPCIVQWCPLNEAWEDLDDSTKVRDMRYVEAVYSVTKVLDPTRPCVDASGGYHGRYTDVFDFHCYHSSEDTKRYLQTLEKDGRLTMDTLYAKGAADALYDGKLPINASEYGGAALSVGSGWGYRTTDSEEDFVEEYVKTTQLYLDCGKISGFCYTQLYDVEQEQNGLYTYERVAKLSKDGMERIRRCNLGIAKIEQNG